MTTTDARHEEETPPGSRRPAPWPTHGLEPGEGAGSGDPVTPPDGSFPLYELFPALRAVPRVPLGDFPSPVEGVRGMSGVDTLWLKRDDLNAPLLGGNKVRSLEFLLAGVGPDNVVLTLGGVGSTHVLATAAHAARLGAPTVALRWRHEMHPVAHQVGHEAARRCERIIGAWTAVDALARAQWMRRRSPHVRYVPIGGSTPLGVLGHVNAALELAAQVRAGLLPEPARLVVPLGSGGTAAGLALGLSLARLRTVVVGARVGPRIAVNRRRVLALAEGARRLIERTTGAPCAGVSSDRIEVAHEVYGGAYGRATAAGAAAGSELAAAAGGLRLDATYSEKALAAALLVARATDAPTLFWLTFDSRWMDEGRG